MDDIEQGEVSALRAEVEALRSRLQESDDRMHQFMARLAHELRTPLGAILMWAHVLRVGRDADRDVAVDAIEASARAESKLIGDLLDVAHAVAGRLRIERSTVDLRESVRMAVEAVGAAAVARAVRLDVSIADHPVEVSGDLKRLGQLVSNMVGNAIKFTPEGGVVDVQLMAAAGTARIVVRDTGRGIPRDELPDIFKAFRPSADLQRPAAGGLGLGLAFVRLVAELHGGTASAQSDGPGRGSTFVVEIPLQTRV